MKIRIAPIFVLIIISTLLGSQPIAMKLLLEVLPPLTIASYRFLIAGLIMLPLFLKNRHQYKFGLLLLPMLIFNSANTVLFLFGLSKTTPNATQVLYASTPIIVALASIGLFGDRLSKRKLLGLFTGLLGVSFVVLLPFFRSGQSPALGSTVGNLIIFAAVLCWSGYTLLSQVVGRRYQIAPSALMTFSLYANILFILPLAFYFEKPIETLSAMNFKTIALLLYIGIATTIVAYWLYQWVIRQWSATTASLTTYIQPPIGYLIAFVILGAPLSIELIVGTAITFVGVLLLSVRRPVSSSSIENLIVKD